MKLKKAVLLILALAMVFTMFAACGKKEPVKDPETSSDPSSAVSNDPSDPIEPDEDPTEIEFWWYYTSSGTNESVFRAVEDAVNEITEREINVHVNFTWIMQSDYPTQLSLAIANGEQIDWAGTMPFGATFQSLYANGSMMDITDLIDENAQELKALFGDEMMNATSVDGKVYAVGTYRPLSPSKYFVANTPVLEEIGMVEFAQNMTTWSELEELLAAISDGTSQYAIGHSAIGGNFFGDPGTAYVGTKLTDSYSWDVLGDTTGLVKTDNDGNVTLWVEDEDYIAMSKMVKRWNDLGYVYPDAAFTQDDSKVLITQGVYASCFLQSEYGVEASYAQIFGATPVVVEVSKTPRNTNICQKFNCFIPSTAVEPAAAVKFTNLLYTNADLMNLLVWGIEGESYVVNDGVASYPEGKDGSTAGYHMNDYAIGNQYLLYPWTPNSSEFRAESQVYADAHPISPYLGCVVDTSDASTLLATINGVVAEYRGQISCGMYSDSLYNEYVDKLHAVGVEDYLALFQSTLDDFLA